MFVLGYMLTDTEHDGRETVLLSLLVAAVVLVIADALGSATGSVTDALNDGDGINDVIKVG